MNLTDERIIKALDTFHNRKWVITEDGKGDFIRVGDLVDLIKRLQAKNNRLKDENDTLNYRLEKAENLNDELSDDVDRKLNYIHKLKEKVNAAKSETRKELAKKLKEKAIIVFDTPTKDNILGTKYTIDSVFFDNLLKEME
jgi:DNA repair ATPase RecN